MNLSKKIIVIDGVLSREECSQVINFYNAAKNNDSSQIGWYNDTLVYHTHPTEDTFILSLTEKIKDSIKFLSDELEVDWTQVVAWPTGASQNYHKDHAKAETVFTSITYLNSDYTGGETSFLSDMSVVPKTGRTVYFDGNHYVHGVNEVKSGTRYTIPIWYSKVGQGKR